MSDLVKRSLWGIIYVVVMMGGILVHPLLFALVFGTLLFFTQYEFYAMVESAGHKITRFPGSFMGVIYFLLCFAVANNYIPQVYSLTFIPIILIMFIIELFRSNRNTLERSGLTILGFIYIAGPFSLMNFVVHTPVGGQAYAFYPRILAGVFFIIWVNDSFAYLLGTQFGKHKMCPNISPKKSWEGLVGGAVFGIIMGIVNAVMFQTVSMMAWIVIAVLTVSFGTLGDLFESKLKREIGAKDSGNILPGHGGFLDRLDSLLFVVPMVFFWLILYLNL